MSNWAAQSGFTLDELAWIQPGYMAKIYARSLGNGVNGPVYALTGDVTTKTVFAAGNFSQADGVLACNNIVRINYNENDIFQNTFNTLGDGLNGTVYSLYRDGNDLYAGGHFDHSGSIAVNNIAKWNGTSWEALGELNGTIHTITKFNNQLYAGGEFEFTKNAHTYYNIAYWDGISWNPICDSINGTVRALTPYFTRLIIGGSFTQVDTLEQVNYVFSYDGSTLGRLGHGLTAPVRSLTHDAQNIIAGGDGKLNETDTNTFGIKYYNEFAGWRHTFEESEVKTFNAKINRINSISGEYVGGQFSVFIDYYYSHNTGKYNCEYFSSFSSPVGEVFAIIPLGKKVFYGGTFDKIQQGIPNGGSWHYPANNLAVWDPDYVGIKSVDYKEAFFSIAPNPIQNKTTIQSPYTIQSIKIMDINGKLIFEMQTAQTSKELELDRGIFPSGGIYFVNIQNQNGMAQSQKLWVE